MIIKLLLSLLVPIISYFLIKSAKAYIDKIFFSQTHRMSIDHPFYFLIGHRPALFQLAITGSGSSPDVKVEGFMDGVSLGEKCLKGPPNLSSNINTDIPNFDDYFSVTLSFNGKQEKLSIGYNAITQFTDPSTDFALQFASNESAPANEKASKDETTKDKSNLSETTEDQTRNKTKTESESTGEVISFDKFKKKK